MRVGFSRIDVWALVWAWRGGGRPTLPSEPGAPAPSMAARCSDTSLGLGVRRFFRPGREEVWRLFSIATLVVGANGLTIGSGLSAEPQGAAAAATWRVAGGTVQVRCPLTVGGSFNAVTSAIAGSLLPSESTVGAYDGQLIVDLEALDTGIGLRNTHMRDAYLEVDRGQGFAEAVLSGLQLDTAPPPNVSRHRTTFEAALLLHGTTQRIAGDVELRSHGGRVEVRADFPVSLESFGIPPPRYLGVGVRDRVDVSVTFDAVPASGQ